MSTHTGLVDELCMICLYYSIMNYFYMQLKIQLAVQLYNINWFGNKYQQQ